MSEREASEQNNHQGPKMLAYRRRGLKKNDYNFLINRV
jgi:hypothetical protein